MRRASELTEGNDPYDRYGHGTHVSAILGGDATESTGSAYTRSFWGTAYRVRFVNPGPGSHQNGSDSNVIAAIGQAIALKSTYNIRIINLSLGRPVMESYMMTGSAMRLAVEAAWKAGIVVVVASGETRVVTIRPATLGWRHHYFAGQRPLRDYSGRDEGHEDAGPRRRSDGQLLFRDKSVRCLDQGGETDLVAPGNKITLGDSCQSGAHQFVSRRTKC